MAKGTTGKIKVDKKTSLFYRRWQGKPDKSVLLFVHGMGEHSGRYGHPVQFFGKEGYTIYAYDQRGHGRSDGQRAYAESFAKFIGDLNQVIRFIKKKEGDKKIYLIGHSFGGQVVLTYGARHPEGIEGIIVSSPNLRLAMPVPWLKKQAGLFLSSLLPGLAMDSGVDPNLVSHDEEEVEAYANDPLINTDITVRLASEMFANQDEMLSIAEAFEVPCLLMHAGDDQISDPEGTEEFFEACAASDKTLELYPGFYHELFNEVDKLSVFSDMKTWLQRRS